MKNWPAVVVHGMADAAAALAPGLPVRLLSAEGAACFIGVGWWQALVTGARARHPATPCADILDCGDSPGRAMAALRMRQPALVLAPDVPAFAAVRRAAAAQGAVLLGERPPALDLADPRARLRLAAWLEAGDSPSPLG
ncbi:MAG: hypothetical protein JOZ42_03975 [Acetobacteraceae bacterium]|nr:hypothetical protein [Acetobacteraceae bacterium]